MPCRQRTARILGVALAWGAAFVATAEDGDALPPQWLRERAVVAPPVGMGFASTPLSEFQPAGLTTKLRRTLLQYEALTADGAWDEAIDLIEKLQSEAGADLTQADPEGKPKVGDSVRYLPSAEHLQHLLASLPAEGLEAYRARRERTVRDQVDAAMSSLDEAALQTVVRENSATEAAGEALLALAELALERGDGAAVRRWCRKIHPLLSDPRGLPADASLVWVAPEVEPARLAAAWRTDPRPDSLASNDETLVPAALARMILASLHEGDLHRARAELRLLVAVAPEAAGRVAGRTQPLAPALEQLLSEAASNGETAAPPSEPPELAWAWDDALKIERVETPPTPWTEPMRGFQLNALGQFVPIAAPQPSAVVRLSGRSVVAVGLTAYRVEGETLQRIDLRDGTVSSSSPRGAPRGGENAKPRPSGADLARMMGLQAHVVVNGGFGIRRIGPGQQVVQMFPGVEGQPNASASRLDPSIAVSGGRLFVRRIEAQRVARSPEGMLTATTDESLVAIDPKNPDAATPLRYFPPAIDAEGPPQPGAAGYQFVSAPTVHGDRLYVAVGRPGTRAQVALACYAATSGRFLWKCELGTGEPISPVHGARPSTPAVVGDTVYLVTNLGAIAAVDAEQGRLRWLTGYGREAAPANRYSAEATSVSPCVVSGDRLLATPSDAKTLLALDTSTGRVIWKAERPDDAQLVGVVRNADRSSVIVAGTRVASYDTLTGAQRFAWPESPRAGLRGVGTAAVFDGELYWPTRTAIVALDPLRGVPTREPIGLSAVGDEGANLVMTDHGLLVCGAERIRLLAALYQEN